jgi:hypothetical protein
LLGVVGVGHTLLALVEPFFITLLGASTEARNRLDL